MRIAPDLFFFGSFDLVADHKHLVTDILWDNLSPPRRIDATSILLYGSNFILSSFSTRLADKYIYCHCWTFGSSLDLLVDTVEIADSFDGNFFVIGKSAAAAWHRSARSITHRRQCCYMCYQMYTRRIVLRPEVLTHRLTSVLRHGDIWITAISTWAAGAQLSSQ